MGINKKTLTKIFHSTIFSLLVLLILVGGMYYIATSITATYYKEPDFGSVVMIRQTDIGLNGNTPQDLILNRQMILDYITSQAVLEPIAKRYGWNVSIEEMRSAIDVRERQESRKSFIIYVNTRDNKRSMDITRALAQSFVESYKVKWKLRSEKILSQCQAKINKLDNDLKKLLALKEKFNKDVALQPSNNEIEMQAVNEQLVIAQQEFLSAYGNYINAMEAKRSEMQLKYDLACKIYTPDDKTVRNLKLQLDELDRQCRQIREVIAKQKPDLYRLTMEPRKLTGLPSNILYYYDNVQTLQQLKLSLMLKSLIEEKEKALDKERRNINTIQRLLDSDSCDVFIREV
ncbi:MAG: hypothetical protein IJW23_10510 [Lentisphaeria bacterium]|nr:hypothetical protein [Lentisphaeria bacterium]